MIDDSFVWGLCGFTVWRCMTGAYISGSIQCTSLPKVESCL